MIELKTNTYPVKWILIATFGSVLTGVSAEAPSLAEGIQSSHEQQQRTLEYVQAIASKYSYPAVLASSNDLQSPGLDKQRVETAVPNKCIPLLGSSTTRTDQMHQSLAEMASNVSFPVKNINMPVAPASGSINSALRLLSTFDSHLSGSSDDVATSEGEIGDDDDGSADESDDAELGSDNVVKFRHNRLRLQGLNLSMLNIHVYTDNEPKFALGITIKNTTLTGRFIYDGPTIISDSRLAGYYRMSIDNIYLVASSNLTKKHTGSQVELATNEFKLNITNLGYITIDIFDSKDANVPTTNYLLRMLQRLLQRTIKRTYYTFETYIRETLESQSRKFIDCELTRFSSILQTTSTTDSGNNGQLKPKTNITQFSQSDLARIINGEIVRSRLDSVSLPTFDYQQSIFGSGASIHFDNGSMSGLDHLILNGETRVKLQDEHLIVNASIGWLNLRPYYNWKLHIGSPTVGSQPTNLTQSKAPISKGFVAFNIKAIDFDAIITKGLGSNSRLVVEELVISRLDNPKMDIGGLPGMNRVARAMVNFFMARLKQRVTSSIQPALKMHLERSLNRLSLFA